LFLWILLTIDLVMVMFDFLRPDEIYESIDKVDFESLRDRGFKNIFIDLDNTLIGWRQWEIHDYVLDTVNKIKGMNFRVLIFSNAKKNRVQEAAKQLGIEEYIYSAKKPLLISFKKAIEKIGIKPCESVIIGDQLLTDVFGGKRAKFYTIWLMKPINEKFWRVKVIKNIENFILRKWGKALQRENKR
jgi:HAD superfamily phosphatase (TIGR01668 family)